ncbi:hypothetical protein D931_03401 [Enterococcus faecium 13.SD.W.09]|nr:hypothetical protein D931_03401 [Enterococcus faecium 13.SD.W.09]
MGSPVKGNQLFPLKIFHQNKSDRSLLQDAIKKFFYLIYHIESSWTRQKTIYFEQ